MSVAVKTTKTKKYKTTEVHVKRIDAKINRITFGAICRCNHLTPASEAKMENLLVPGSAVVPTLAETIRRNEPDFWEIPAILTFEGEVIDEPKSPPDLDVIEPESEAYDFD